MNGNGSNGNETALLERIVEELVGVREEQVRQREEIKELHVTTSAELGLLRQDVNRGFAQVNGRIDNVLAIAGGHHDDHEQRIQALEQHVLGKTSG